MNDGSTTMRSCDAVHGWRRVRVTWSVTSSSSAPPTHYCVSNQSLRCCFRPSSSSSSSSSSFSTSSSSSSCRCSPASSFRFSRCSCVFLGLLVFLSSLPYSRGVPLLRVARNSASNMDSLSSVDNENPCGHAIGKGSIQGGSLDTMYSDIAKQAHEFLGEHETIFNRFVDKFQFKALLEEFGSKSLIDLPILPSEETINTAKLEDLVPMLYSYLQQYASHLETVLIDQIYSDPDLLLDLNMSQVNLRSIRCELHTVIRKLEVQPLPKVKEPSYQPKSDESERNLRDYFILRDYGKVLRFIHTSFKRFAQESAASSS